jgi:hypothetical protein
MYPNLDAVLKKISDQFRDSISIGSRFYLEVNIGREGEKSGYADIRDRFANAWAIVPLKGSVPGMKVRIDGRTFVNYAQIESGVAIPGYVAKECGLPQTAFVPNDSMILNCA